MTRQTALPNHAPESLDGRLECKEPQIELQGNYWNARNRANNFRPTRFHRQQNRAQRAVGDSSLTCRDHNPNT